MKYLYRIEDEYGYGPYSSTNPEVWTDNGTNHSDENHPTPMNDEGLVDFINSTNDVNLIDYCFAFSSRAQLRKWFSKTERKKLRNMGFRIKPIPVELCSNIVFGKSQAMFK